MNYYNHVRDPYKRYLLRSAALKVEQARITGVSESTIRAITPSIEVAILTDLTMYKTSWVTEKWDISIKYLQDIKKKYKFPKGFKPHKINE